MNALRLIALSCCLGLVAAACGRSAPTGLDAHARVGLHGGVMHGSGNRGTDSTSTQQSAPSNTQGSGVLHGSGN